VLGLEKTKGIIAAGADADFAILNAKGEVLNTIIGGLRI
jgi:N-acetylglucosamine-6-phosphate deacetylase